MSTTSTALMTAEELLQLPDDDLRHELINGELITMPPPGFPHGRTGARLMAPLALFVWDHELGEVFNEVGYKLTSNPDTVLEPDVSFISKERLDQAKDTKGYWLGPPDIAVEVLSPSDSRPKTRQRVLQWLGFGAKQVWIANPKDSTVTIHHSPTDSKTFSGSDCLEADDILPGFRVSLERIFGPTSGRVKESMSSQEKE